MRNCTSYESNSKRERKRKEAMSDARMAQRHISQEHSGCETSAFITINSEKVKSVKKGSML